MALAGLGRYDAAREPIEEVLAIRFAASRDGTPPQRFEHSPK
jgi:hypothetical protein